MIGRTLGHYRVTDRLGEGGMGVVYRAEDLKLGRTVALKFLPPELTRDPDSKKRFEREAKAASQLDHPNICTILDFGESDDDGQMYMAMPCYDGESLADRVMHGPVSLEEAIHLIEQIARGLGKAHACGIVHRDIKPENVIVTRDGVAKILDFGLAKLALASRITKSNQTVGTAAYMSPEQIRGEDVGPQADIWSLGVVFYELLTGRLPFGGEYLEAVAYSILNEQPETIAEYPDADRIIKRMLRKDPLQRYQTIEEFLADLHDRKRARTEELQLLRSGARLGPYEILMPVAASVYLAKDTRLDRHVAIKVLPPGFPQKERYRREAKKISQLTHPNICTLFDVGEQEGVDYVVMEFLEGETLAQKKTPLPVAQVLKIGMQIADGLSAAHKAGVLHRDLRPANVMITKSGAVKLLDFGLVKDAVAYLSPEQVEGKEPDARSDLFALGLLLYELLTGRPPFSGASKAGLMAAILEHNPAPLTQLRSAIPPALDRLIRTCLEKNPDDRFETAHDVMLELRSMTETAPPVVRRRVPYLTIAAVLAVAALGYALYRLGRTGTVAPRPHTFAQLTFTEGLHMFPTLAPDGKSIAYVSTESGNRDIYLQRVDGRMATNLTSDSPAEDSEPAFSPDGSQIAFRSERDGGGIFVMGVTGESVRRLSDFGHNPSWSPDSTRIVVSTVGIELRPHNRTVYPAELWLIDTRTSAKRPLIQQGKGGPDFGRDSDAVQPSWSPHGHRIAFWGIADSAFHRTIWTIDPDAQQPKQTIQRVTSDPSLHWNPVWSPDGKELYFGSNRDGTMNLWRVAMNEAKGTPAGTPQAMPLPAAFTSNFSFSRQGELAYLAVTRSHRLIAFPFDAKSGRTGTPRSLFASSQEIVTFQPSPDGLSIAFTAGSGAENLFIANADGARLRRLTNDPAKDRKATWSPDGKTLYFYSNREGRYRIWSIRADGSGLARVTDDADLQRHGVRDIYLTDLSPDGQTIAAQTDRNVVTLVHLDRPAASRLETLAVTMEGTRFSPDGRRLAGYTAGGVMVYSLPEARHELVLDRGVSPLWLPDGKHIAAFEKDTILILDLDRRQVISAPFAPMDGVRLGDTTNWPRMSRDASVLYVRQILEQGNIWMVHFEK